MRSFLLNAEEKGAIVACRSCVTAIHLEHGAYAVEINGGEYHFLTKVLVNCAGLYSDKVAALAGIDIDKLGYRIKYCKGNYFSLSGRSPFSRLIYPAPETAGLGVHLTLDLGGRARFGPDVEWTERIDYDVDPLRAERFYGAIRRYWPALKDGMLAPAYSGIRPKLHEPDEPARDFLIQGPRDHGIPGLVNLFGIESPGLTASLAIGDYVRDLLDF